MKTLKLPLLAAVLLLSLGLSAQTTWNCGSPTLTDVTATLDNGTLTISGTGAMQNFANPTAQPWKDVGSSITNIVIESGVTTIGAHSFSALSNLTAVNLTAATELKSIGTYAFNLSGLTSITIPATVTQIDNAAFHTCSDLNTVVILSDDISIGGSAFLGCRALERVDFFGTGQVELTDNVFTWTSESLQIYAYGENTGVKSYADEHHPGQFVAYKFGISLNITEESHTFPAAKYEYEEQEPFVIEISASAIESHPLLVGIGEVTAELSGDGANDFDVNPTTINDIAVGGKETISVKPKTGLAFGTHTATLLISPKNGEAKTVELSFTVECVEGHRFGEWEVVTSPTCTEAGLRERICEICGEKETESIPETGHDWGEWTVITPATCMTKGEEERVCLNDASHKETRETDIDPDAHDWGEWTGWITEKAATCTEAGSKMRTRACRNNPENHIEIERETIAIDEDAHDWGEWGEWITEKAATCTEAGSQARTRICQNDPEHIDTETAEIAQLTGGECGLTAISDTKGQQKYGIAVAGTNKTAKFTVSVPEAAQITLAVYDNAGNLLNTQQLQTDSEGEAESDWKLTNSVSAGTYIVVAEAKATSGERYSYSAKFVVKR